MARRSGERKRDTEEKREMHRGDSMIRKYTYGKPFQTESVVVDIAAEKGQPDHGNIDLTAGFSYTFGLEDSDIVYGLG